MPRLKEVELWGIHVAWGNFPFSKLTRLELHFDEYAPLPNGPQLIAALGASPLLEILSLRGCGPDLPDTPLPPLAIQPPLILNSLHTLLLAGYRKRSSATFLVNAIKAPILQCLIINDCDDDDYTHFVESIGKGFPSVTEMHLRDIWLPEEQIEPYRTLFSDMPLLRHLGLDDSCALHAIVPWQADPSSASLTCPLKALETLQLYQPLTCIPSLLAQRQESLGGPLERLLLDRTTVYDPDLCPALTTLVNKVEYFDDSDTEGSEEDEDEDEDDDEDDYDDDSLDDDSWGYESGPDSSSGDHHGSSGSGSSWDDTDDEAGDDDEEVISIMG